MLSVLFIEAVEELNTAFLLLKSLVEENQGRLGGLLNPATVEATLNKLMGGEVCISIGTVKQ